MLSGQILAHMGKLVQMKVLPVVPKIWRRQFLFGYKAVALKPITSLNANARSVVSNRNTAESTMTRTLHNDGLPGVLGTAVAKLATEAGLLTPTSLVNCDHSDFDGLVAFVCAVQTGRGRAVPVFANTSYSGKLTALHDAPPRKRRMRRAYNQQEHMLYEQTALDLADFADTLGFWPRLVFDRGFSGAPLVRFLVGHGVTFYARMKAGRLVDDGYFKVSQLPSNDALVMFEEMKLRVVRSRTPSTGEPWYILTSDLTSTRAQILKIYYYRFEIEESFKDVKHIRDLHKLQVDLALSLKVVLWFVILGIILLYLSGLTTLGKNWYRRCMGHPKKRLSWYRWLHELLEWMTWQPLFELATGGM
jgi:DDE family transposase